MPCFSDSSHRQTPGMVILVAMSRACCYLLLMFVWALRMPAQSPELGRVYGGTLDKIVVQTVTICEAGQSVTQEIEVRPGTPIVRSRACTGHSVEINILDAGFPAVLPLGTLERNATAGPHLRYASPIETRGSARFTLARTDPGKTNRGYGAFINVPLNDSPSGRLNGACANVSQESPAAFTDRIERTLTQSNCIRASQYVAFEPLPNSIAPAQLHVVTIFNAGITIPGEPAPGVSIVLDAVYNMQETSGPDVTIDRMFSVQAVQRVRGTPVQMIPGKATLVRVFPKSVGDNAKSVAGVRGLLSADEFPGSFLRPMNTATAVTGTPDVDQPSHSFNFLLPKEWTLSPKLTLNAVISLGDITESNTENNKSQSPLVLAFPSSNATRPVHIDYWDICLTYSEAEVRDPLNIPDGSVACPTDQADRGDEPLRSILPVDEDRFTYQAFIPRIVWPNGLESYDDAKAFLRFLTTMTRILNRAQNIEIAKRNELFQRNDPIPYYRLVPWLPLMPKAEGNSFEQFWSLFPATAFDWCQAAFRPDLRNAGCSALSNHQLAYKFTITLGAGGGGPADPSGDTGFHSGNLSIVKTMLRSRIDQVGGWINALDYEKVAAELRRPDAGSGNKALKAADESTETLMISGSIRTDGSAATFQPAFRFSQSGADPGDPNGGWCVRLQRAAGTNLDSCFEPLPSPDSAESTFVIETPWYPDITRVSLFRRGTPSAELAALIPGDPPALSFSTPRAGDVWEGKQTINWSAAPRSGEPLTYMLLYSSDGGTTWLPLGVDLKEPRFELDTSQIAGGTGVSFRVIASSGLNSASVDVGPISIRQSPRLGVASQSLDFRNRTVGEVALADVSVLNTGSGPLTVTPSLPDGSPFSFFSSIRQIVIPAGRQQRIRIQYRPLTAGQHRAELRLAGAGSTEIVTLRGSAFEAAVPSIEAPLIVDFGNVALNTTKDVPVTIRNAGQATLNIQSVTSSSTSYQPLTSALEIPEGGQADLLVRVRLTASGLLAARLTIRSNDPTVPSLDIAVRATGAGGTGPVVPATLSTLQVDDNTFETTFGFPDGGVTAYFVNRLTPTRYPATLRSVQIFFPQNELPAGSNITVLAGAHASGAGGNTISGVALERASARVNSVNAINEFDVTPITITSGDFIVGFSVTNPRDIYPIATDTSSASRQRSYLSTDPNIFRLLDSVPGAMPGNFGIRARVE